MTSDSSNPTDDPPELFSEYVWWYKPLIWAGFVALLYLLREFFLIGFLTFLICYAVRSVVEFLSRRFAPNRESRALDITLTISIFITICLTLYGVGAYFLPQVVRQGKSLVVQLRNMSASDVQNDLLSSTIGSSEFRQKYGDRNDVRYQKAFQEFRTSGRDGEGLYQAFPKINSRLRAEFEADYEKAQIQHLKSSSRNGDASDVAFDTWLMQIQVPKMYAEKPDYYRSSWQAEYTTPEASRVLESLRTRPDFESYRDQQIRQRILADLKTDSVLMAEFKDQWIQAQAAQQWAEFRKSPEYQKQFESFFERRRADNPAAVPIGFQFFQTLSKAYPQGKDAFLNAVQQQYQNEDESLALQEHDFESATKLELGRQWWATSHVADWVRNHEKDGPEVLATIAAWFERAFGHLVRVPIQVATSLVLAIFILMEWHGLRAGARDLRNTRLQPLVDEIAPGIIALGKLIGKSFQGQIVIAAFNTLFTLLAMWLIGVEYKFILALIVFVFSFIPVVGVILTAIPICAIALLQPGGSVWMVVQVLVAIAVVHVIEGTVLSPRIIGKIGHLHPVVVIAILLVGEHFFGMWGLVLGVPVAIYLIRVVLLNKPIPGVYEPNAATS